MDGTSQLGGDGSEHHSVRSHLTVGNTVVLMVSEPSHPWPRPRHFSGSVGSSQDRGSAVRMGASVCVWVGLLQLHSVVVPIPPMRSKSSPVSRVLWTRKVGREPQGRVSDKPLGMAGEE